MNLWHARRDAERGDTGANPGLEKGLAARARNGRCQKDRIYAGPIALFGLQDIEPAAQKTSLPSKSREHDRP